MVDFLEIWTDYGVPVAKKINNWPYKFLKCILGLEIDIQNMTVEIPQEMLC